MTGVRCISCGFEVMDGMRCCGISYNQNGTYQCLPDTVYPLTLDTNGGLEPDSVQEYRPACTPDNLDRIVAKINEIIKAINYRRDNE
jgi:hypothetical protein